MKSKTGLFLLLASVTVTMIGSVLKILRLEPVADLLLATGTIGFLVAVGIMLQKILSQ